MDKLLDGKGIKYEIKYMGGYMSHYCGYATFPARFLKEKGYGGIVTYVPVHGGVTYAEQEEDGGMTYGFDCAHAGDDEDPKVRDQDWLADECKRMAVALLIARDYEDRYLMATTGDEKAAIIDEYHTALAPFGIEFNVTDNFGAMISIMFGRL